MAHDATVAVTEEARDMVRSLETNDPGAPSAASIREVTGARLSTGVMTYLNAVRDVAEGLHSKFQKLLGDIRNDRADAVKALEGLNSQDQEMEAAADNSRASMPSRGVIEDNLRRPRSRQSRLVSNILRRATLSALAMGALVVGMAGPALAQAAPLSDDERVAALWYADRLKFDELQAQGATGEGIKIAVIDAAINPDVAELQGANVKVMGSYCVFRDTGQPVPATSTDLERAGHGTSVVSMLVGNGVAADGGPGTRGIVPDAEVMFYATGTLGDEYNPDGPECEKFDVAAGQFYEDKDIRLDEPGYFLGNADAYAAWQAIDDGADIIVYSIISADNFGWTPTLAKALRAGVPVVAGTPNPDGVLDRNYYPYSLNGAVAVSGVDNDGNLLNGGGNATGDTFRKDARGSSNLGFVSASMHLLAPSSKDGWGPAYGSGTSLATPLVAGTLAIGMQKFPDATANQVLQAMIRTTGNSGIQEPEWLGEKWGYGIANPTALLTANPLDYPDENPLFAFDMDDPRCAFPDGETVKGAVGLDGCAWATAPSGEEVWPAAGEEDNLGGSVEPAPGDAPRELSIPAFVWVSGGMTVVGVLVTAIVVPVVVTRARKRSIQVPPHDFDESETYRG